MKRQRIKSKRRRLRIFVKRILRKAAENIAIVVATLIEMYRAISKGMKGITEVIVPIAGFSMFAIYLICIFLWAFWDVIVLYFS